MTDDVYILTTSRATTFLLPKSDDTKKKKKSKTKVNIQNSQTYMNTIHAKNYNKHANIIMHQTTIEYIHN